MERKITINQAMAAARTRITREQLLRSIVKTIDSGFKPCNVKKEITAIILTQSQMFADSQINLINYN